MTNLIIAAGISEESQSLAFREVTYFSRKTLNISVLILSERQLVDLYFIYLKNRGLLDFVDYLISLDEKEEPGIKIDNSNKAHINVKGIRFDNQATIIDRIDKIQRYL